MSHQTEWRERLMDKFCVMFERASRKDEPSMKWPIKLESFIATLIAEEYERGVKDGKDGMDDTNEVAYKAGQEKERTRVVEVLQKKKAEMKSTHFCPFNDGAETCDCFIKALDEALLAINVQES